MSDGQFLNVRTPDGFKFFDFQPKVIKAGLRDIGKEVSKETKKALAKKAVSHPGEFPGMQSGTLRKAVGYKVSRSGRSVWITTRKTAAMKVFYPAFVIWGHRGPGTDSKSQQSKKRKGAKVAAPRANYVVEIAQRYQERFAQRMEQAFNEGFKT